MQAHDIHVSLDDHQALEIGVRLPRLVEAVQLAALVKQRGFRRIQVFRLALIDDAAAECDDPPARIANREHQAVAKAVIEAGLPFAAARVALDDQTCLQQAAALLLVLGPNRFSKAFQESGAYPSANFAAVGRVDAAAAR